MKKFENRLKKIRKKYSDAEQKFNKSNLVSAFIFTILVIIFIIFVGVNT